MFDRNWAPSSTVFFLLSHVWGLFFRPDTEDPLDSVLALSFYENPEAYRKSIEEHVRQFARKSRAEFEAEFLEQGGAAS